jgi:hypothetical protein
MEKREDEWEKECKLLLVHFGFKIN